MADLSSHLVFTHPEKFDDHKVSFTVRFSDGKINASTICQEMEKDFWKFLKRPETKSLRDTLGEDCVDSQTRRTGTWVHPTLAMELARWISPSYATLVEQMLFAKLMQQDRQVQLSQKTANEHIEEAKRLKEQITADTQQAQAEHQKLTEEIERLQTVNTELQRQVEDGKIVNTELQRQVEESKTVNTELQRQVKDGKTVNAELQRQVEEVRRSYDRQISAQTHWDKWENEYKTCYEYVRERYRIDMKESTCKKLQSLVYKDAKYEREETAKIGYKMRPEYDVLTQFLLYNDLVDRVRPYNAETIKPTLNYPRHYKQLSPSKMYCFHRIYWDFIEKYVDLFINDPPVKCIGD